MRDDLTSSDVATMLGISQSSVARIDPSKLPYWHTPGRHRRYRESDVIQYASDHLGRQLHPGHPE